MSDNLDGAPKPEGEAMTGDETPEAAQLYATHEYAGKLGDALILSRRPVVNDDVVTALNPAILRQPIEVAFGHHRAEMEWATLKSNIAALVEAHFQTFKLHANKDNICILNGSLGGSKQRNQAALVRHYLNMLDGDGCIDANQAVDLATRLGLFTIIYCTHSHNKRRSEIRERPLLKWLKETGRFTGHPGDVTLAHCVAYLIEKRGIKSSIFEGATLSHTVNDKQQYSYVIEHGKMPRVRMVFVLKAPFDFTTGDRHARIQEYKGRYLGLVEKTGCKFDPSCADPTKLIYLPCAPPDAKIGEGGHEIIIVDGDFLDLSTIEPVAPTYGGGGASGAPRGERTGGTAEGFETPELEVVLKLVGSNVFMAADFARHYGPQFVRHDYGTEGKIDFECPTEDAHSKPDPRDRGFCIWNASEANKRDWSMFCPHTTCEDESHGDRWYFLDKLIEKLKALDVDVDAWTILEFCGPKWIAFKAARDAKLAELAAAREAVKAFDAWCLDDATLQSVIAALDTASDADALAHVLQAIAMRATEHTANDKRLADIHKRTGVGKRALTAEVKQYRDACASAVARLRDLAGDEPSDAPATDDGDESLTAKMREYNKRFAFVRMKQEQRIVELPDTPGKPLEFMKLHTFLNAFSTDQIDTGRKELTIVANAWMKWKDRNTYMGVEFDPSSTTEDDTLNLWRGFSVQAKQGDWSLLRRHLFENVCRNNPFWFAWTMAWLANIVQDPTGKMGTAIVAQGDPGVGKTKVAQWVKALMIHNAMIMSKTEHIFGRFNSHLGQLLFAGVEEAFWAGDKQAEGVFKDLITGDKHLIEPKGVDPFELANFLRFWICSNENWVVPVSSEDRRFFVLRVDDAHKKDKPYFAAIDEQMKAGGLEAMMYDLRHLKQPKWIELREPPKTPWLAGQVEESFEVIDAWWHDVMREGIIADTGSGYSEWPEPGTPVDAADTTAPFAGYSSEGLEADWLRAPTERVWASLQQFGRSHPKRKGRVSKVQLGKFLATRGVIRNRPGTKVRVWCYDFPPLAEMRAKFTADTGVVLDTGIVLDGEDGAPLKEDGAPIKDFATMVPAGVDAGALAVWAVYGRNDGPLPG